MIVKNERKNLPRLFESIKGCFHEIHITDTGSTDGTLEWLKEIKDEYPVFVHHFDWCNDFAKARNYSFSHVTTDFVMWMDADDVLSNRESFIQWSDNGMEFCGCWFATYHYALDKDGNSLCSFVRERVFARSANPQWRYPIHEGVMVDAITNRQYITTWSINHMRDSEDIKADKSRNLKILEEIKDVDARLQFYYGKELFEAGKIFEAIPVLEKASKRTDIEHHDKILALQYGAYSALSAGNQIKAELTQERSEYFLKAIDFCQQGIKLDVNRAEFYVSCADAYIQIGNLQSAVPMFAAAKYCINSKNPNSPYEGAIYSFLDCYGQIPQLQLSRVYLHMGRLDDAKKEAQECYDKYKNAEALIVLKEVERLNSILNLDNNQQDVDEIVFTTPPQTVYEFDEQKYKDHPMGGSETALIEMAKNLKILTNKPVKVFNMRANDLVSESGVEYISNNKAVEYFSKFKPKKHIAWRHNIKMTKAPTYLWCHDLVTSSVEAIQNFDKIMCLSPFHREYVKGMQGVPHDKIILTRNGLTPEKFEFERKPKDPNKIVWMSSADRGLDRCMIVMDEVIKEFPDAKLHVYYGYENLYRYGPAMSALADRLKAMIAERPYVVYHGSTEQKKMYREVSDAVIWLHPCNFIETFAITAIEMLALGIFPVTRRLGGLKDTLNDAETKGQAILLDHDCVTKEEIKAYINATCRTLLNRAWERVSFDIDNHSWKNIAKEWAQFMEIQ